MLISTARSTDAFDKLMFLIAKKRTKNAEMKFNFANQLMVHVS